MIVAGNHAGKQVYTLSGVEALSKQEIADAVSAVIGKPIAVVQVPLDGLVQGMVSAGLPEPLARVFASFDTNTAAGRVAEVTTDFQRITGREQQPFRSWLDANKAALAAP